MTGGADGAGLSVVDSIARVPAAQWDLCAGEANPFVGHAFLSALEDSGSVGERTGWIPHHAVLHDAAGRLLACAPLYIKTHSYGEYVFDHGWAEAYARAGGRYYPKLQLAVPFTPVPGPRLLLRDKGDDSVRAAFARGLVALAEAARVSSLHATFCEPADIDAFAAAGMAVRTGFQFHWENRGYADFEAFLAALSHAKRKAIRKERRDVAASGVELVTLTGDALEPAHWDAFHEFYLSTSDRKWGHPYLTRAFFARLHETLRDRVVLVLARHRGEWVAGALNLLGADTLYGRNWGASEAFKNLHFEACYYRALDFAIARGLSRVEAGAQGEHKLQRGYLPAATHSAHWIRDRGFREAVVDFLGRETPAVIRAMEELRAHSPFKSAAG
jgi:hypothetical protein